MWNIRQQLISLLNSSSELKPAISVESELELRKFDRNQKFLESEVELRNFNSMNRTSSIECNKHEQNKFCYMCVVGKNSKWVCYNDIRTWFSNESFTCIFYDLSLFTTLMTTAKMICTADRIAYTICFKKIEHILYV